MTPPFIEMKKLLIAYFILLPLSICTFIVTDEHLYGMFGYMLIDDFTNPIYSESFDANAVGKTITIPLKNKYDLTHGLQLKINSDYDFEAVTLDPIVISYEFFSDGKVIDSGVVRKEVKGNILNYYREELLEFKLPYKGLEVPVDLNITLLSPIEHLKDVKDTVYIQCLPLVKK